MDDLKKTEHVVMLISDRFTEEVWKKCLPGAGTSEEKMSNIRAHPSMFLENLTAFAEYLLLDQLGEFRPEKGGAALKPLAEYVLAEIEKQRDKLTTHGMKGWALACLSYRLREMLGMEATKEDQIGAHQQPSSKMRLAKGWKVRGSKE